MGIVLGAVAVAVASILPAGGDPGASLSFAAEPGAFPVSATSGEWATPVQEVRAWEHDNVITVDGETDNGFTWLVVELAGADGAPLAPGTYTGVTNRYLHPENAGITVISNGLACGEDHAEFTIGTLERDASTGRLTALDVAITHRCGAPTAPALTATAHFRA
ncbi:hypothetical protein JOD54_001879 [Actinokineospora baliensis]|uniref:hypothetical protein n=1 Tax=Actinokineospora baliensis TaxID=547056 RepID=UPI00195C4D90|nr:hypothetical protein [Actinokineospora baliensis]MBM7771675.1 hypothetical protein [Actinokineospora baliensis]